MICLKILLLGHGVANDGCKRLLDNDKIPCDYLEIKDVNETYDLIVKSPGISLFDPFFVDRKEKIISDIELAYNLRKIYIISITGTNAKTTVSSMINYVLKDTYKTVLCGNIGYSICDAVVDNGSDAIYIVEASSFQLEATTSYEPDISVLLNIFPHHLDHHKTLEHYVNSKLKQCISNSKDKYTIYSLDNPYIKNIRRNNFRNLITFSNIKMTADIYNFDNKIYYKDKIICKLNKKMYESDIINYMAVVGVLKVLNVNIKKYIRKLKTFKPIKYRLEKLSKNIYNDAKSTNQYSTIMAIKNFNNVLLISGGYDRGEILSIQKEILNKIIHVYAYGQTGVKIKTYMDKMKVKCSVYNTLEEAFNEAYSDIKKNTILLYSPMFASYDQYQSYNDRGYEFELLVKSKKEKKNFKFHRL